MTIPFPITLASGSPRRHELMRLAGIPCEKHVPSAEEKLKPGEAPLDYAKRNAREKQESACEALKHPENHMIITADTIVTLDGDVLEKPGVPEVAETMLAQLSGKTHHVITGVGIWANHQSHIFAVTTEVEFRTLTPGEIKRIAESGEVLDKAGAYAAQGSGATMIRQIRGSYSNVIGLPIAELLDAVQQIANPG